MRCCVLAGDERVDSPLSEQDIAELMAKAIETLPASDKRALVIIPDHTRTAPVPLFFRLFCELLAPRVGSLDFMIALGTHPVMPEDRVNALIGVTAEQRASKYADVRVLNHRWNEPSELKQIGTIPANWMAERSGGLMREDVPVVINRHVPEYDLVIICGPVFPHEVVGFSGGNKYLFPGVSGERMINVSHWLGALITNPKVNGTKDTPIRAMIDRAAEMVPAERLCFAFVVHHAKVHGLYIDTPEQAWSAAADLSGQLHIVRVQKPFRRVLARAPEMYDDIWTAGKCMYKLEPIVADGGELIIYAPHVTELSYTHGKLLDQVGYHVRDYFLNRWPEFQDVPKAILAHSSHVRGIGRCDNGREEPRVKVTLATGISPQRCARINLGYRDPEGIRLEDFQNRESAGVLCVPKAGEMLYRLADPPEWQREWTGQ